MKISITMISNAMSHHQLPFCEYMASQGNVDFKFVATKPLTEERLNMGYADLNRHADYIIRSYENVDAYKQAMNIANESDFLIYGSAPYEFIKRRLKEKKWTFLYSERIFKNGIQDKKLLKKIASYFLHFTIVPHSHLGLLCASAYAAKDFRKFGLDAGKMYKWGYFPPNTEGDVESLILNKDSNSLLWVGRMIALKHPELPIKVAKMLKAKSIPFHLTMIGNGEMYEEIRSMVTETNLEDCVTLTGALPKDVVRNIMEKSQIFMATSDHGEGWGAVINEGMNSACAVVASKAMGAAPFLIENKENGLLFSSENEEELYNCVEHLLLNHEERMKMQQNAFETITEEWNGAKAGEKLLNLFQQLKDGNTTFCYEEGVCSRAKINI